MYKIGRHPRKADLKHLIQILQIYNQPTEKQLIAGNLIKYQNPDGSKDNSQSLTKKKNT